MARHTARDRRSTARAYDCMLYDIFTYLYLFDTYLLR
jgi:hypothetical protein